MSADRVVIVMRDKVITVDDTNRNEWQPLIDYWQTWLDGSNDKTGATINMAGKSVFVDYRDIIRIDFPGSDR